MVSDADVRAILVDGSRAVGVRLADGTEVAERKLVCSTVSVEQTFLEFLEPLPDELRGRIKNDVKHKDWTLFSVHLAMSTLPEYSAAEFDPDVNRAWVVNLGYGSLEEFGASSRR